MSEGIVVYFSDGSESLLLPAFSSNRVANMWLEARRRGKKRKRSPSANEATELHHFDFDHTLFRSPGPIGGRVKETDAEAIDTIDSWFNESLSGRIPEVPNINWWIPETVEKFRKAMRNPRARVVVSTGRYPEFEPAIRRLLESQGLEADEIRTKDPEKYGKHGTTTQKYKAETMKDILSEMPRVRQVHIYDDKDISFDAIENAAREMGHEHVHRHELPEHDTRSKQIEKYGWNTFLCQFYECGHKKVPNTHGPTKDKYPEVTVWTLIKNDPSFRNKIIKQYQRWISTGALQKKKPDKQAMRLAARWLLRHAG